MPRTLAPLLFLPAFVACHRGAPPQAPAGYPPVPVTVVAVAPRDVPLDYSYLGRTEGSREVEIRARVAGFLEHRSFVEGTDVAAGAPLFELDARPLQAQRASSAADVTAAEARLARARRDVARLEPLVPEEAVSKREFEDAQAAERVAVAELAAATARLQQVEVDLSYTKVTAPIAGRIGRVLRPEGSLVGPTADGLLTNLIQLDPLYAHFHRSETQQQQFEADVASGRVVLPKDGFAVELQHRDGTVLAQGGRLDYVDGHLDETTGTIPLRATVPNPSARLRAGQSVQVVLRGAVLKAAITVPQRAVQEGPTGKIVMLAVAGPNGTVVEPRPVEVGEWVDLQGTGPERRSWVVRKGLSAGDKVIVDNLMRLRPGAPVTLDAAAAGGR